MSSPPNSTPSAPEDSIDFATDRPTTPSDSEKSSTSQEQMVQNTSPPPRIPSLRTSSDSEATKFMTASSTPLGMLSNARRPQPPRGGLPSDMQAKMKAFHQSRQGTPPSRPQIPTAASTGGVPASMGIPAGFQLPPNMRPSAKNINSAPAVPKMGGLSARRGLKLPGGLPGGISGTSPSGDRPPQLDTNVQGQKNDNADSAFNKFSEIVDTKDGTLKFAGKAVIHGQGIDFTSGNNFSISLDEVDTLEELGRGNYGTVYKVRHARPRMRRPGMGLAGNKLSTTTSPTSPQNDNDEKDTTTSASTSGVVMAMKEIRLELEEAKFAAIIMELDILHRCLSPYIIDFYGAFFQEGAVYICIEFMDGGSVDKIYGDGVPENVLRKITYATTQGLKTLKDDHNIIHRDVKPTNILVNTRGQVKICDFGVSGNLVASIAKTNIGCQSYMAPERISGGGVAQAGANPGGGTYSVQSDIWSLGLTIIECALGRYPYPPETYNNIFSQLSAIVDGEPPDLPEEGYSPLAKDFVRGCLNKIPKLRPTYSMLLAHGWLATLRKSETITEDDEEGEDGALEKELLEKNMEDLALGEKPYHGTEDKEVAEWVINVMDRKKKGLMGTSATPALHKAPLDSVGGG